MTSRIPPLVLAMCALAAPALAQTGAARADDAFDARAAKAAQPETFAPGRIERFLTMVETNPVIRRTVVPGDGPGVRIGGIDGGSAVAAGPAWRATSLAGGSLHAYASGAVSMTADYEAEAGLAVPHAWTRRLSLGLGGTARHLANERFFGTGSLSHKADETAFALDRRELMADVSLGAADWLTVSSSLGTVTFAAGDAEGRRVPAISTRFAGAAAPGLGIDSTFQAVTLDATVDYRDVPENPRSGGRYRVAVTRYADAAHARHSFTRIDAEVEQHLSAWKRQRVLTLRAVASSARPDRDQTVPFYLQPALGGSRLLRGFVTDRFRDLSLLAVQAEYGWDVSPFLNAVLFYEAGAVAARWQDIGAQHIRRDYGLGFRFGSARTVAFRTDVALGSGEGPRISMRLHHAF